MSSPPTPAQLTFTPTAPALNIVSHSPGISTRGSLSPPPAYAVKQPVIHFQMLATPPPPRHFPLPPRAYFTPELFDDIALFLLRQQVRYNSIRLMGRGVTRDEAEHFPAIIVEVPYTGAVALEDLKARFLDETALVAKIPRQVKVVEFKGITKE